MNYRMLMPKMIKREGNLILLKKGQIVTKGDFPIGAMFKGFIEKKVMVLELPVETTVVLKISEANSEKDKALAIASVRREQLDIDVKERESTVEDCEVEKSDSDSPEIQNAMEVPPVVPPFDKYDAEGVKVPPEVIPPEEELDLEEETTGMVALTEKLFSLANTTEEAYLAADHQTKCAITRARKKLEALTGK